MEIHLTLDPGTLFVVSTPIGNMGDFSFRAVEVLRAVAGILAEDTRHSRRLMDRYAITTPLAAYHEHNEAKMSERAVSRLLGGEDLALISDAGTPLISDPGERLVAAAAAVGVPVTAVPGASALLAAIVLSALPTERFTFFGFLNRTGKARREGVAAVATLTHTAILYEAPGRLVATLEELRRECGDNRRATVMRELTKRHEDVRRGTLSELMAYYANGLPRGEVVIVIEGSAGLPPASEEELRSTATALRAAGVSARAVVVELMSRYGAARNLAYRLAHE
ncbi:MAG: 16S rRNA (cytidine(1402)-2'-O)-methyltransferase [Gemmatimonadaceae bacterium]